MAPDCRYPETPVLYRRLQRSFPRIVRGEGCWLFDDRGGKYLDACSGAFVSSLGHGVREIGEALALQASRLGYVNGTAFTHDSVEELAAELAGLCAPGLDKCLFLTGGGDAVEASLKLARQHWAESGRPGKTKIIALTPNYHGSSILALSASSRQQYRALFSGWLIDVAKIPAPYPYRCACRGESSSCPACSGAALEERILREGPETVAAFIGEPVGGSSTGASVPRPDYWKRVRALCDKHEVLWIADEVLTGAGRTGTWSALEPYGAVPDIQIFAKGLTAGYGALSAVVTSRRVLDPIARGSGAVSHNQTFAHHPMSCAAALATIRLLKERGLVARCARMGRRLHERLAALAEHPAVGDVRGRGLLAGIELVADKATRAPFPRAARLAETLTEAAQSLGLALWPNSGQADGTNGDLVMIAPPFVVSDDELELIVARLRGALDLALKKIQVPGG